jgi:hypothetical protein
MTTTRARAWTPAAIPFGILIALLGAWAAVIPLVGPYFGFGFDTDDPWVFSQAHVTLSLIPGSVACVAGLLLATPRRQGGLLAGTIAFAAGAWLLVGPSLYPVWSSGTFTPQTAAEWKQALLWIATFYGVGGLIVYLAGFGQGLLARRVPRAPATRTPEPVSEPQPASIVREPDGDVVQVPDSRPSV